MIRRHEQSHYDGVCGINYFGMQDTHTQEVRAMRGKSICSYSIDISGISITSDTARDVVFIETKLYDKSKLAIVKNYVDELFGRLARVPVEPVARATDWQQKDARCSDYDFVVRVPDSSHRIVINKSLSLAELDSCLGNSMFPETAAEHAKSIMLTKHDIWINNLSPVLTEPHETDPTTRVAKMQLFDDGWRVMEIVPPLRGY